MQDIKPQNQQPKTELQIAAISTILIHALLLLVFTFINVGWQYEPSEWVEMEFVAVKNKPSRQAVTPPPAAAKQVEEKKPEADKNRTKIKLPSRKMLEEDESIIKPERSKISDFDVPNERRDRDVTNVDRRDLSETTEGDQRFSKSATNLDNFSDDQKQVKIEQEDLGRGVSVPFQIEGEAADRTVIYKVIPEYPPGVQKEATVKFRFSVLPSGVVVNIVPVLKADAILEKVALDAFQQWRFSELGSDVEQRTQAGAITFRFVLR